MGKNLGEKHFTKIIVRWKMGRKMAKVAEKVGGYFNIKCLFQWFKKMMMRI